MLYYTMTYYNILQYTILYYAYTVLCYPICYYAFVCYSIREMVSTVKSVLERFPKEPNETKINGFGHILLFPFVK